MVEIFTSILITLFACTAVIIATIALYRSKEAVEACKESTETCKETLQLTLKDNAPHLVFDTDILVAGLYTFADKIDGFPVGIPPRSITFGCREIIRLSTVPDYILEREPSFQSLEYDKHVFENVLIFNTSHNGTLSNTRPRYFADIFGELRVVNRGGAIDSISITAVTFLMRNGNTIVLPYNPDEYRIAINLGRNEESKIYLAYLFDNDDDRLLIPEQMTNEHLAMKFFSSGQSQLNRRLPVILDLYRECMLSFEYKTRFGVFIQDISVVIEGNQYTPTSAPVIQISKSTKTI